MSTDPTAASVQKIPVVVDYTNRDFYSLRDDLITRVKDRVNSGGGATWYGNDPADFGVALVEAFSYMGDIASYYVDRIANEATILTATQRESILNLALSYGYTPATYQAATCTVQLTNPNTWPTTWSAPSVRTLPAGSQLTGRVTNGDVVTKVTFSTTTDVQLSATAAVTAVTSSGSGTTTFTYTANNSFVVGDKVTVTEASTSAHNVIGATIVTASSTQFTVAVTGTISGTSTTAKAVSWKPVVNNLIASHGENVSLRTGNAASGANDVAGEVIGTSNGNPGQIYRLRENQVVQNSVVVYVQTGNTYGKWTYVDHLVDYGPNDSVYTTFVDANNNVYVQFGDGVSGALPNNHATIKAQYVYGGGVIGNIPLNTLTAFGTIPGGANFSDIAVTNITVGVGGLDPESLDSIRVNAPQAFSSANRAITLTDYASLALRTSTVGKANASGQVWSSITLYVSPRRDLTSTDPYPGKTDDNLTVTNEWTTLQNAVTTYMADKTQIGVTLTIAPPTYVDVAMSIQYSLLESYTAAQVEPAINAYIQSYYSYSQVYFGQVIHPEEIEFLLRYVPGIYNVKVSSLYRSGQTAARTTLIGSAGEIFIFKQTNVIISTLNSDNWLTGLTATNSSAGFSPTSASITNVTASTGVVTYTAANNFAAGDRVTITGVTSTPANAFNLTGVQVLAATSTQFTVTNAATGTYSTGGSAFSGSVNTFALPLNNSSTSTTITASIPATATVLINNLPSPATITTPVGTTKITVVVTPADGTSTQTYTIEATRSS